MDQAIFHHYPQSPVSEKVRVAFGIKNLRWHSVLIPRIPPKPKLMPLTGGYRRTPVLQVGADIFCDSQGILRELERRYPEPSLFPDNTDGVPWGLSRWTDGTLFDRFVTLVLGAAADRLPEDFAKDRGRLYLGPDHDFRSLAAELPHVIAQIRAQLGWIEQRLEASDCPFLLGNRPSLPDALAYYLVWFLRGRWDGGPGLLSEFPRLEAWESRVKDLGHGTPTDLSADQALEIARNAEPATAECADPKDPQGLRPGLAVSVQPDGDGGDPAVTGDVVAVDRDSIAIKREDPEVGWICIHFPRVGYRVTVTDG